MAKPARTAGERTGANESIGRRQNLGPKAFGAEFFFWSRCGILPSGQRSSRVLVSASRRDKLFYWSSLSSFAPEYIVSLMTDKEAIAAVRAELSRRFISGHGLEIGAGARPFPAPAGAHVNYGDMRDRASRESYFKTSAVQSGEPIDAQTLAGIANGSLDFVISAHLSNICAIQSAQSSAPFGSSSPAGSIYWSCPRCGELSIATGRKPVLRMCSPIFATAASAPAGTATRSICAMCIRSLPASVTPKRKFNGRRPKRPGSGQSTALISMLGLERDSRRS